MKTVVLLLVVLALLGVGWHAATHTAGDWVVTVVTPGGGEVSECFKMAGTTLRTDLMEGTISWQLANRQVTFAKGAIAPFRVKDGAWESTFSRAGVDGELCTNGPYPDRAVLAQRAMREATEAAGNLAREAGRTLRKTGEAFRELMTK